MKFGFSVWLRLTRLRGLWDFVIARPRDSNRWLRRYPRAVLPWLRRESIRAPGAWQRGVPAAVPKGGRPCRRTAGAARNPVRRMRLAPGGGSTLSGARGEVPLLAWGGCLRGVSAGSPCSVRRSYPAYPSTCPTAAVWLSGCPPRPWSWCVRRERTFSSTTPRFRGIPRPCRPTMRSNTRSERASVDRSPSRWGSPRNLRASPRGDGEYVPDKDAFGHRRLQGIRTRHPGRRRARQGHGVGAARGPHHLDQAAKTLPAPLGEKAARGPLGRRTGRRPGTARGEGPSGRGDGGAVAGSHYAEGEPEEEVARLAEELRIGLIVTGGRRSGSFGRLFSGGFSETLFRRARSAVVVARGPKEE